MSDHFEDLLKMLDILKRIFHSKFKGGLFVFGPEVSHQEREGTLELFEELGSSMLESSQKLCEFIALEGQRYLGCFFEVFLNHSNFCLVL